MTNYVSSIVSKYGDLDKVKDDSKTLESIISRQGTSFIVDVLAEYVGKAALKFSSSDTEIDRLKNSILKELKEAIEERT